MAEQNDEWVLLYAFPKEEVIDTVHEAGIPFRESMGALFVPKSKLENARSLLVRKGLVVHENMKKLGDDVNRN
ncbi:MAG: hypothetical protein FWE16_05815 [Firmicutes bacterium]|nr:hypothetical protein [Bacillota bacterium]